MENKSSTFIRQKLSFLALNPDFQKDVLDFREKWDIPKEGLQNGEASEKYDEWLGDISDKYREGKSYAQKRASLFESLNNAINSSDRKLVKETKEALGQLEAEMPLNKFFNDQTVLLNKYRLSENYQNYLNAFLRSSDFYLPYIPKSPIRLWYEKDSQNKKKIFIEVYAETTLEDVKGIFHTIKRWQKDTVGYKKSRKRVKKDSNYKRDLRIYTLRQQGKTYLGIKTIIKEESGGTPISYDKLAKIVKRMKGKIKDI